MSRELMDVADAARELRLAPSRVRSLIASGSLPAEKVGGRWLVDRHGVLARSREPVAAGRPLTARNAWTVLLKASGDEVPATIDSVALWRLRRSLAHPGLAAMRPRLERRARLNRFWALPAELRALSKREDLALSGSSAAGALGLELAGPDTIDGYVRSSQLTHLVREHGLQEAHEPEANVKLRAVPDDAWMLDGRRFAPAASVALDLASYEDARSSRVGLRLLGELDRQNSRS